MDGRPGAIAQSPGREAALAWASLAQRFPASSLLAREGPITLSFLVLLQTHHECSCLEAFTSAVSPASFLALTWLAPGLHSVLCSNISHALSAHYLRQLSSPR